MIGEFLRRVTAALELTGVPYMLTGSLASSMYGVPRATNDVDLVVAPTREQMLSLLQLFERNGLYVTPRDEAIAALQRETQFNVIDFDNGWKVDRVAFIDRHVGLTHRRVAFIDRHDRFRRPSEARLLSRKAFLAPWSAGVLAC